MSRLLKNRYAITWLIVKTNGACEEAVKISENTQTAIIMKYLKRKKDYAMKNVKKIVFFFIFNCILIFLDPLYWQDLALLFYLMVFP